MLHGENVKEVCELAKSLQDTAFAVGAMLCLMLAGKCAIWITLWDWYRWIRRSTRWASDVHVLQFSNMRYSLNLYKNTEDYWRKQISVTMYFPSCYFSLLLSHICFLGAKTFEDFGLSFFHSNFITDVKK